MEVEYLRIISCYLEIPMTCALKIGPSITLDDRSREGGQKDNTKTDFCLILLVTGDGFEGNEIGLHIC